MVEEVFVSHLEADIPEFRHLKERFSSMFLNVFLFFVCVDVDTEITVLT